MQGKVAKIQANESKLNSAAFTKALAIYRQTGKYPNDPGGGRLDRRRRRSVTR